MKNLLTFFLQGLLYLTPTVVTVYVIFFAVSKTDKLLGDLSIFSEITFPGLGLILIVALITLSGYLLPKLFTTQMAKMMKIFINRVPGVRTIYNSASDLMKALVGKERKFSTPVIVCLDEAGVMHRLGFITANDLSRLNIEGMIGVYLPNSYGLLGDLVIVPKSKIKKLDANPADVTKFIVSGGVTSIDEAEKKRKTDEQR